MSSKFIFTLALFSALLLNHADETLFPQGVFSTLPDRDGFPAGWSASADSRPNIRLTGKENERIVQLAGKADTLTKLYAELPLKPEWKAIRLKTEMRVLNLRPGKQRWHNARIAMAFKDSQNKIISYPRVPFFEKDSNWTVQEVTNPIPAGAVKLTIEPGLYFAGGIFELKNITVQPLSSFEKEKKQKETFVRGRFSDTGFNETGRRQWYFPGDSARNITQKRENGTAFLSIRSENLKEPVKMGTILKFSPGRTHYSMKAKVRLAQFEHGKAGWHNARIALSFRDRNNKVLLYPPVIALDENCGWKTLEVSDGIPENAVQIAIEPGLYFAKGVFDIEFISFQTSAGKKVTDTLPELTSPQIRLRHETAERSFLNLNGVWEFAPAGNDWNAVPSGKDAWGTSLVPGLWYIARFTAPGILRRGTGENWKRFDPSALAIGWYRRKVAIPEEWKEKQIILTLNQISTDARIRINGKEAGTINGPSGRLEVSRFLEAGSIAQIELQVAAFPDRQTYEQMLDANVRVTRKSKLNCKGISGDVLLSARPKTALIDGMFIQTGVHTKTITVDFDLQKADRDRELEVRVQIQGKNGRETKRFITCKRLPAGVSRLTVSSKWENPKLWDFREPNLYFLTAEILENGKIIDSFRERFGFREFTVRGKDFYLNGKKINLAPTLCFAETWRVGGVRSAIANHLEGFLQTNFNILELWPWNHFERGTFHARKAWAEIADEKGFLLMYPAHGDQENLQSWNEPAKRAEWRKRARIQWNEIRNHPSVVILTTLPNTCGFEDDQNPLRIGNRERLHSDDNWKKRTAAARELVEELKRMDPSRPITTHHGANVGDFHSCNNYLDFIPLQEREEWLSEWSRTGTMPYMAVEFGCPFSYNFLRGRNSPFEAPATEPLLTEFAAAYLGSRAYDLEQDRYRRMISARHIGKQNYKWLQGLPELLQAPALQELIALFVKNTTRSWRTWGISGGMLPWEDACGFREKNGTVPLKFRHGEPGWSPLALSAFGFYGFLPQGSEITPPGCALRDALAPAMLWIAGKPGAFTDKTHHFESGSFFEKQAVLINDTRSVQPCHLRYTLSLDGREIASGSRECSVGIAGRIAIPIRHALPAVPVKQTGTLAVSADFNGRKISDSFSFTVFPPLLTEKGEVQIFDPEGKSEKDLNRLGWRTRKWDGKPSGGILVLGTNAFAHMLPGSLEPFVRNGGKLLILGQQPDILTKQFGLRVSEFVSRRMFPVAGMESHPALAGLDPADLRDWNGSGTLRPERAGTELKIFKKTPRYGWHWGNRGSVVSAAVEKPHYATWTPVLEGEFDLAYTPLMERAFGKGFAVFCALDVTGRTEHAPAADRILQNLLVYLHGKTEKQTEKATYYLGGTRGKALLETLQLKFQTVDSLPRTGGLLILGENNGLDDDSLKGWLSKGGNLLLLERGTRKNRFGFELKNGRYTNRAKLPDWQECAGISRSELRPRTDLSAPLFSGPDTAADGLLARVRHGSGTAILISLLPDELNESQQTYLRFTAWRMSRALMQIAGNLGAQSRWDTLFLNPGMEKRNTAFLPLSGPWKMKVETRLPTVTSPRNTPDDPGDKGSALGYAKPDFNDSSWAVLPLPGFIESLGGDMSDFDGTFWVRKQVFIPKSWKNSEIMLNLGIVDDCDKTFFNGVLIGEIDKKTPRFWSIQRTYPIPADQIRFDAWNTIAVRIFDHFGSGGIIAYPEEFGLKRRIRGLYSTDYIDDQNLGDNPFRYRRW